MSVAKKALAALTEATDLSDAAVAAEREANPGKYADDYYTKNDTFNPPDEVLARCSVFHDLGSFVNVFNSAWSEYKSKMGN